MKVPAQEDLLANKIATTTTAEAISLERNTAIDALTNKTAMNIFET